MAVCVGAFQVISIFGQPENCTNACKEILQVMQQESTNNNRGLVGVISRLLRHSALRDVWFCLAW